MKIAFLSRILIIVATVALLLSLFVPIWSIYLNAPQYPEGLRLQIWANKIAGDIDIVNGLNHYIGMKTLHSKDFIEFTLLPYIICFYILVFAWAAVTGKRKALNIVLGAFVLFGVIAMVDFWKWEYDYGHNLDPNAAIKVPGMTYQPPLIGFKQLLNFGAYSVPDIGGWLFVGAGLLLLIAVVKEARRTKRRKSYALALSFIAVAILFSSCTSNSPQPVLLNKDACDFCKMTISDGRFVAELITRNGRIYKFDDMGCLLHYIKENGNGNTRKVYVADFKKNNVLTDATTAWFIQSEALKSPMAGNIAAFPVKDNAIKEAAGYQAAVMDWGQLKQIANAKGSHEH
ncbi:nitrous oxide reductase accessory protein NosL [Niabella pedocola]|uniref:Nitrous oxide reductase accessory protein NosL n=1 Tax=Niabella pedocola TaxID=1752077 RepID=A0ABS8PTF0_9BACT|nr:nitrous oxide reductase accessory protein NosL [Niabella pedocola]MCD2424355.1 nitrous oxide reductase accessory protein NosL [Niabella pedocola]